LKSLPDKDKGKLAAYWKHLGILQQLSPDRSQLVTYFRKPGPGGQGRFYARTGSAQALTRLGRLATYAQTHQEIDLSSAHLALLLASTTGKQHLLGHSILELRFLLEQTLKGTPFATVHTQYAKHVIFRILYGSTTALIQELRVLNFFIPPIITELVAAIEPLKRQAVAAAAAFGYIEHALVTDKNRLYYAMEFLEVKLLLEIIGRLQQKHKVTSCIWLHDGVWISPPAPEAMIHACLVDCCKCLQLPLLPLRIVSLSDELQKHPDLFKAVSSRPQVLGQTTHTINNASVLLPPKGAQPSQKTALSFSRRKGVLREPHRILHFLFKKKWLHL
jgi:hypothetical protein